MSDWGVIGDGPWGMSLAKRLGKADHYVRVGGVEPYGEKLPRNIEHTTDLKALVSSTERLVFAVSINEFEQMIAQISPYLGGHHRIVSTARGLTPDTHIRATEAIAAMTAVRQMAVLAGAADVDALRRRSPVALVVGTAFPAWATEVQDALSSEMLRVYTNGDMAGVELANVVAAVVGVALGVARSMKVGPAAEATALTRALAEMDRVVGGLGGRPGTAYGLAGLGVLGEMVYEGKGASFRAGAALAGGDLSSAAELVEVREAARTLSARVKKHRLHAPLVAVVEKMFAGELTAADALDGLMNRPVGPEEPGHT